VRKHLLSLSETLTFDEIAANGMPMIVQHLLSLGIANVSIKKEVAVIKCFLRWAVEHDYTTNTKFLAAKTHLSTVQKTVVYLDWDELMAVYEHDFSDSPTLSAVRDVFCFCAFTSLRYSDVANLRTEDIYDDHICVTTIKTSDTLNIELNKYSRAILDRYRGCRFDNGLALPVISNQKSNKYLKEIGRACELTAKVKMVTYKGAERIEQTLQKWELLTTHAARRTFVCNALMLGIPADIVMKWTGHSDYKAMKPYIAIADRAKRTAMSLFDSVPPTSKRGTKS
jgi:integrase